MKRLITFSLAAAGVFALSVGTASAAGVFGPAPITVAIDFDGLVPNSRSPGTEGPINVTDQVPGAKYLNFGGVGSGVIVTPAFGSSIIQSLSFTTANDAPGRDPLVYELSGTNDAITSANHSLGDQENWTAIASGSTGLENFFDMGDANEHRLEVGPIQDITNSTAYTSYRFFFTTLRNNDDIFQVGDIAMYTGAAGGGDQVLQGIFAGDTAVAVTQSLVPDSDFPGGEAAGFALDMDPGTKYLNFGAENSGMIVRRGVPTIVDSLTFTTANDAPERDPLTWELYGTDDPITSAENSDGGAENWTLIDSGNTDLEQFPLNDPTGRGQTGAPQAVNNTTQYGAYRIVFPTLRDAGAANSMQVAEINFGGTVIPEPSTLVLALLGFAACGRRKR